MTIIPFDYEGRRVRVVRISDEPWFILADLCKILSLSNPSMVAKQVDADALSSTEVTDSLGRPQGAAIVSEAGMYQVVFLSRKPQAAAFRRWVTHEVLPSIRRRGGYLTPEAAERALTDPDFIIRGCTGDPARAAARPASGSPHRDEGAAA
ncbi:MAG: Bro-N domain-containing protein [Propionibacterium acidifaciens]|uniref:BRO-N domain-containing protein n=1 Tax=Propionibacterium acidifaciens TaxID=556499 RepID=UPI0036091E9A